MKTPPNRTLLLVSSALALASALPANAQSALSFTNDSGGTADFYGQFSPVYLGFDDGEKSFGDLADNAHSNSRVGLRIGQPLQDNLKLGFWFETGLGAPVSSGFSQDFEPVWDWQKTDLRHVDFHLSGDWGKVSLGQGSMASDSTATSDLSGTTMASTVATADTAGSYFFRLEDGTLSDVQVKAAYKDADGFRLGRIRYDTPSFNGLTLATSYGEQILSESDGSVYYDIAAHYRLDSDDFAVAAGAGYGWRENDGTTFERYAVSASLLHKATGLNGTAALGSSEIRGSYYYLKAGWIADYLEVGTTALSADYYGGSDHISNNSSSDAWGIQFQQNFDDLDLEAYIAYSEYGFDDDLANYMDAKSTIAGFRWKF